MMLLTRFCVLLLLNCVFAAEPELAITPSSDPRITVTEGEAFSFTCQATGWPIPTVQVSIQATYFTIIIRINSLLLLQWTRGSVSVMQMGGSITYTENIASRSNGGNYNCTATNTVGSETESRSVLVIGTYVITYPRSMIIAFSSRGNNGQIGADTPI